MAGNGLKRSAWRADLWANSYRSGYKGLVAGWLTSPGFRCVTRYRIARWFGRRGKIGGALAVLIDQINANRGCYISFKAEVDTGLRLPHPVGVVIGEGSSVGRNATIYQNVTLGRKNADRADYPSIGDDVTVYAGSTLIGGISIGEGAIIGAHCLVKKDVAPGAVVTAGAGEGGAAAFRSARG